MSEKAHTIPELTHTYWYSRVPCLLHEHLQKLQQHLHTLNPISKRIHHARNNVLPLWQLVGEVRKRKT